MAIFVPLIARRARNCRPKPARNLTRCYPPLPGCECAFSSRARTRRADAPLPLLIDIHGGASAIGAPVLTTRGTTAYSPTSTASASQRAIPARPGVSSWRRARRGRHDRRRARRRVAARRPGARRRRGLSAGGTLALAVPQLPELRGRIAASVAY